MMTAHYEEMMELWKVGNFLDAIKHFSRWMPKGFVSEEESESFKKELAKLWELVEVECEENPEVVFTLYEMLKKDRNWDDEALCKKLRINRRAIEDIKNRHMPRSEGVGLKMLYELFPQMAV
jgi:hypothetical protein